MHSDVKSNDAPLMLELGWNEAIDNVDITEYEICRDSELVGITAELSFADTGLPLLTTYAYDVVAVDLSGNPSVHSEAVDGTTLAYVADMLIGTADDDAEEESNGTMVLVTDLDLELPSIPQNLQAHSVQGNRVDLSWEASTDNVAVAGCVIYRNGEPYWRTTGTTWSDTQVEGAWRYDYTVEAYDPAGNFSGQSDPATAFIHLRPNTLLIDDR